MLQKSQFFSESRALIQGALLMGCNSTKEGAVAFSKYSDENKENIVKSPKKELRTPQKSTHERSSRKPSATRHRSNVIRLDEVANASDSDWGELIEEIAQNEPLKNAKRRRLSISTVHGPMEVQEATGSQAERRLSGGNHLGVLERRKSLQKATSQNTIPGLTSNSTEIVQTAAAKLLQNGRANFMIEDANQLKDLFPNASFFGVFGEGSEEVQGGFDNKTHEHIGSMPTGLFLQDIGVGYSCRKGLKPESPNQDDFFVLRVDDWSMYGVFDGHGPYGHHVSGFVHRTLPYLIVSDPDFKTDLSKCLRRAFHKCNALCAIAAEKMEQQYEQTDERYWDCLLSGTTCTIVVTRGEKVTIAYVGDSRVIAGSQSIQGGAKKLSVHELSSDHKPQNPEERRRINKHGGEVRKLEGDIPHRVFCKGRQYPGLAMSRALGDSLAQSIGVSCDPDISEYSRSADDLFIVVASDGVWEFLKNDEVAETVYSKGFEGCQKSSDAISIESWKRWLQEEGNVVDDITCLVIWNELHLKKKAI